MMTKKDMSKIIQEITNMHLESMLKHIERALLDHINHEMPEHLELIDALLKDTSLFGSLVINHRTGPPLLNCITGFRKERKRIVGFKLSGTIVAAFSYKIPLTVKFVEPNLLGTSFGK